jgi:endonuclease VIII
MRPSATWCDRVSGSTWRPVPEGDTLFRTAAVLREVLAGRQVSSARGRPDGAQLERVVGSTVTAVTAQGKHLLIDFSNGLTLHTHLRMHGSWHRYRPWETWKRPAERAVAVIATPNAVAVCFDAPTVELLETRAVPLHPQLSTLGPDLLAPEPDLDRAIANLALPERAATPVGEALLDQSLLAGLGNIYRSEVLWQVSVSPFVPLGQVEEGVRRSLVRTGAQLLRAGRTQRLNVYGRAGRPCRRCGTLIRTRVFGEFPRRVFWCPRCQPDADVQPGSPGRT